VEIKNIREETRDGLSRAVATVVWEDVDKASLDIYFETSDEFRDDLVVNPNAFLVGCCLPAMYLGEKRIKIEGEVCSILHKGIVTNIQTFRKWYGSQYRPIQIDANIKASSTSTNRRNRAGLFFSGGVDSIFSLRNNRLTYPLNHPSSIKDCFLVHGFDIYHDENSEKKFDIFDRAMKSAAEVAKEAQVNLIPVFTNVRHLYSDVDFWIKWFHGAALSSVAHCFTSRISMMYIASTDSPRNLQPWGSHPSLDRNYSSLDLKIIHDKLSARIEKIKIIADWDIALQNLRVCTINHDKFLNCGRCIKCIKTMAMLLAIGKLKYAEAFPIHDLSPQELKRAFRHQNQIDFKINYLALVDLLEAQKRYDLARAILDDAGAKGNIRRFDEQCLGGKLAKLYSFFLKVAHSVKLNFNIN